MMKITIAAILAAALNIPAAAIPAAEALPAERPSVAAVSLPAPADKTPDGRFCWTGKPDATAAGLGMPALFCVDQARLIPDATGFKAEVSGKPLGGRVSAAKDGDTWTATLFRGEEGGYPCSDGSGAVIELRFKVDGAGYMTGVPVISARSEYTSDVCHSDTHVTEIPFNLTDQGAPRRDWRRGADPVADELGMPSEVFLEGLRLDGDKLFIAAGAPVSGRIPVSLSGEGDTRRAEAVLFSAETGWPCGSGSIAEIVVSFQVDRNGAILSAPKLKASSGYTGDVCHSSWQVSEIVFEQK